MYARSVKIFNLRIGKINDKKIRNCSTIPHLDILKQVKILSSKVEKFERETIGHLKRLEDKVQTLEQETRENKHQLEKTETRFADVNGSVENYASRWSTEAIDVRKKVQDCETKFSHLSDIIYDMKNKIGDWRNDKIEREGFATIGYSPSVCGRIESESSQVNALENSFQDLSTRFENLAASVTAMSSKSAELEVSKETNGALEEAVQNVINYCNEVAARVDAIETNFLISNANSLRLTDRISDLEFNFKNRPEETDVVQRNQLAESINDISLFSNLLSVRIDNLGKLVNESMSNRVDGIFREVSERYDQRIQEVETKVDDLDEKFEELDQSFSENLDQQARTLRERVVKLEDQGAITRDRTDKLMQRIGEDAHLHTQIDSLTERIEFLNQKIAKQAQEQLEKQEIKKSEAAAMSNEKADTPTPTQTQKDEQPKEEESPKDNKDQQQIVEDGKFELNQDYSRNTKFEPQQAIETEEQKNKLEKASEKFDEQTKKNQSEYVNMILKYQQSQQPSNNSETAEPSNNNNNNNNININNSNSNKKSAQQQNQQSSKGYTDLEDQIENFEDRVYDWNGKEENPLPSLVDTLNDMLNAMRKITSTNLMEHVNDGLVYHLSDNIDELLGPVASLNARVEKLSEKGSLDENLSKKAEMITDVLDDMTELLLPYRDLIENVDDLYQETKQLRAVIDSKKSDSNQQENQYAFNPIE